MVNFKQLSQQYRSELLDKVIPFWLEKSQDMEFGGYFTCLDREGKVCDAVIEVNKPLKAAGWTIYQYDYDAQAGPESRISVLELVRDPWQPFVLAGILMMLCGALCLFLFIAPRPKKEEVAR